VAGVRVGDGAGQQIVATVCLERGEWNPTSAHPFDSVALASSLRAGLGRCGAPGIPQGLKPVFLALCAARLKPCPDTNAKNRFLVNFRFSKERCDRMLQNLPGPEGLVDYVGFPRPEGRGFYRIPASAGTTPGTYVSGPCSNEAKGTRRFLAYHSYRKYPGIPCAQRLSGEVSGIPHLPTAGRAIRFGSASLRPGCGVPCSFAAAATSRSALRRRAASCLPGTRERRRRLSRCA